MSPHDRMHRRHAFAARDAHPNPVPVPQPEPVQTIYSVVYVTASKTFSGDIGGYSTDGGNIPTTSASADPTTSESAAAATSSILADGSETTDVASQTTFATSTSALPTAIASPTSTLDSSLAILAATSSLLAASNTAAGITSAASSTSSASASTKSSGMSVGGKAGMAIGILLLIGAILSIILFCFKRRREAEEERLKNEKQEFAPVQRPVSVSTTRTSPVAPRLSLRPITQFVPNLMEKRASRGNALATPDKEKTWERSNTAQSNNVENPFGNHAETIDSANASGPTVIEDANDRGLIIAAASAGVVNASTIGLARGASKRANAPPRMDFTTKGPFMGPPSPAGTEFSMTSESGTTVPAQTSQSAAIAAAGGPTNSAVHRVQLDFKPSMEDELELRAGQLIRMLHEYDDGWALCIRLDRSQQGVVPRTCLSTRPVKPRPQQNGPRGPPPGMRPPQAMSPGGSPRPMTPNGQQQRPMTPSQQRNVERSMTPSGSQQFPLTPSQARSMSPASQQSQSPMQQRPMSPAQPRPSSPAGPYDRPSSAQSRPRSPSVAQQAGRKSPPGPSPMNASAFVGAGSPPTSAPHRKPVPGQAL